MRELTACLAAVALVVLAAGPPAYALDAADPLAGLPGEVSAVLYTDGAPRLLLAEKANGLTGSRVLRIGDEYREGWKLASATPAGAILRKGAQTREILFKSEPAATVEAAESVGGTVATTNAVIGGSPRGAGPRRPEIDSALAAIEAQYGAKYLDDLVERTGISRERVLELTARGVPPPPPPPLPPPPPPTRPF